MPLNIEKSGQQDKEQSKEWLVNTGPGLMELTVKIDEMGFKRLLSKTVYPFAFSVDEDQTAECAV